MSFKRAAIIGAGTMGHGIAQVCAMAGIETTLIDLKQEFVDAGLAKIEENLDKGVAKGKVAAADRDASLARLSGSTARDVLSACDLFIEAAPEKMSIKHEIFAAADRALPEGALLGTNTSSLSVTEIASQTARPEDVIGLHFFNPVHIMRLLEIVRGAKTSKASVQRARDLGAMLNKTAVVVEDSPGFATSRLGITLGNEAMRMVAEGVASPADIDTAMKLGYGHPMGPLALTDLVGLDVRLSITEALFDEIGSDVFKPPMILRKLVRAGCLGKKSGAGFYLWEEGKPGAVNPMLGGVS